MMDKSCRNYLVRKNAHAQCRGTLSISGLSLHCLSTLSCSCPGALVSSYVYATKWYKNSIVLWDPWAMGCAQPSWLQCSWWEQHKAYLGCCRGRDLVLATVFTTIKFIICIWATQTSLRYKWKVSLKAGAFSVPWWMFLISAHSTLEFIHITRFLWKVGISFWFGVWFLTWLR